MRGFVSKQSGGRPSVVNGVIEKYLATTGTISANTFVEFVYNIQGGTETVFNSGDTTVISTALIDSTHVLVAYEDGGNSNYGTAQILTINGTTITVGTEYVFNSASTLYISTTLIDSTHVLVAYEDFSYSTRYGTAQILTISGTTITVGAKYVFNSLDTYDTSTVLMNSNHVLVAYYEYEGTSNSYYGTAQVLTISGTTITAGTEYVFNSATSNHMSATLIDSTHVLVTYEDGSNSNYGTAQVLTISGTTITIGTKYVFNSAGANNISTTLTDSTHVLITYIDGGNSNYGTTQVLTISGTTITAGAKYVFNSADTVYISPVLIDSTHVLVAYEDGGNSNYGTAQILTINGTTITTGTEYVFNSANTFYISATLIDSTHVLVAYGNVSTRPKNGAAQVLNVKYVQPSTTTINGLTKSTVTSAVEGKVWTLS